MAGIATSVVLAGVFYGLALSNPEDGALTFKLAAVDALLFAAVFVFAWLHRFLDRLSGGIEGAYHRASQGNNLTKEDFLRSQGLEGRYTLIRTLENLSLFLGVIALGMVAMIGAFFLVTVALFAR
jgi:hypothetical protein